MGDFEVIKTSRTNCQGAATTECKAAARHFVLHRQNWALAAQWSVCKGLVSAVLYFSPYAPHISILSYFTDQAKSKL